MSVDFYAPDKTHPKYARAKLLLPEQRRVMQTTFYDPHNAGSGNCTEACVATLFNMPLTSIPVFYPDDPEMTEEQRSYRFWRNLENVFSKYGMWLVNRDNHVSIEGLYLGGGLSKRGCMHMVVMCDGKIIHDPHPSQTGIESVQHCFLPVIQDPSILVRGK